MAAAPRRRSEKQLLFWSFLATGKNRGQGRSPEGVGPTQAASQRRQGFGRARGAPGAPVSPLWPIFWPSTSSGAWIFCNFSGNFLGDLKIHIPAHKKTIQTALLKNRKSGLVSFKSCKNEAKSIAKVFGKVDTFETYQLHQA